MFKLYHSNNLDILKELLVQQMRQGDSDPFIAEQILVQSQGMAHWLKLQVSESMGIAANIEFPLPSSFVWKVYNSVKPDLPERSHFEKESMTWKLMGLLPSIEEEGKTNSLFSPITHYLEGDYSGQKLYALADKIADTFDQYLIYRPDWILAWEAGEDAIKDGNIEAHPWQAELWRRLVAQSDELQHSLFHRARLTDQLAHIVRSGKEGLKDLLPHQQPRIFVFGIAALPGTYWSVLNAISEYVDVHFFLLNPCKNYWGDIVSEKTRARLLQKDAANADYFDVGNPLLASWGKLGRDFITLAHEAANETDRERFFQDHEHFLEFEAKTVLGHVQMDFLQLVDRSQSAYQAQALKNSLGKQVIDSDDQSIQIVSAHSALREVQTLHDKMLSWFENDSSLKPRDILVMVPDIDIYGPYIEAVFGSAESNLRIPWAIADQALSKENPIIDSFLQLLQLPSSRLTIIDVIELLEVTAIAQRFEIQNSDLENIKEWLSRANIRWGFGEQHRQDLGLPQWTDNSWSNGLKQLLLGLVMPASGHAYDSNWPVAAVSGNEAEVLGKVIVFIDALENCYKQLKNSSQSISQWHQQLYEVLEQFYPQEHEFKSDQQADQLVLQKIRDQLQHWQEELELAAYDDVLTHAVVVQYLKNTLGKQVGWQRFLAGPVNFCTLMPMRSIPFKVICMLGMNDEDYPRRVPPQGFDLMAQGGYRRGDRSRREDDRYLFLEAVSSAQDTLYISYRGRDSRENNELQPCVLVSELIDYLANGFVCRDDVDKPHAESREQLLQSLIQQQALQPFNSRYFSGNTSSYQSLWAEVAKAENMTAESGMFLEKPLEDDRESSLRLMPDLEDLKQCLNNPAKFFVQRRLKANLVHYWQENPVDEIFELDNLQAYQLRDSHLDALLLKDEESFSDRQKNLGQLPVGPIADLALRNSRKEIDPLLEILTSLNVGQGNLEETCAEDHRIQPVSDRIVIGEYQLTGTLQNGQRSGNSDSSSESAINLHFRSGRLKAKSILNLWLDHLFSCANGGFVGEYKLRHSLGFGLSKTEEGYDSIEFKVMSEDQAKMILQDLIEFMNESYCQPPMFVPQVGWEYVNAALSSDGEDTIESDSASTAKPKTEKSTEEKQQKTLDDCANSEFSELADEYLQRCFSDSLIAEWNNPEMISQASRVWQRIYQPLIENRVSKKTHEEHQQ